MAHANPLQWPVGWKRSTYRNEGKFYKGKQGVDGNASRLSVNDGAKRVLDELGRMGVKEADVIISTNLAPSFGSSLGNSRGSQVNDPGVAVYWTTRNKPQRVIAVDRYRSVADNLAAVAATLDAMRAIDRHGGAVVMDRAFEGFAALPAPAKSPPSRTWSDILGVDAHNCTRDDIDRAYRELAKRLHPDAGGTVGQMVVLNEAVGQARRARGFQ